MREYEFSLTHILPYKDKVVDFVLIRENTGQWKPVFSHILCSGTRTHFRELPWYKNNNWFLSVTLHWLKQHHHQQHNSAKLGDFWTKKTIFRCNNVTLLSVKHSCSLQVEGWRVRIFSYFFLNVGKWGGDAETLEMTIKSYHCN